MSKRPKGLVEYDLAYPNTGIGILDLDTYIEALTTARTVDTTKVAEEPPLSAFERWRVTHRLSLGEWAQRASAATVLPVLALLFGGIWHIVLHVQADDRRVYDNDPLRIAPLPKLLIALIAIVVLCAAAYVLLCAIATVKYRYPNTAMSAWLTWEAVSSSRSTEVEKSEAIAGELALMLARREQVARIMTDMMSVTTQPR